MEHLRTYLKANRGKQIQLAQFLGLWSSTVCQWRDVPAIHVRKVAEFTGISTHDLRPDIFGTAPSEARAEA